MTCFMTHFPLSLLSLLAVLLVIATLSLVKGLAAKRRRLQTVNLTTAPAKVRQNLRGSSPMRLFDSTVNACSRRTACDLRS